MRKYLSLIKFSHTIFAMPFALIGFFLAKTDFFEWETLIYVILCMVFARSAAMAYNRYIDRDIDRKNPRTSKIREIPSGLITPNNALLFVIINSLLFITTTYLINNLCFALSPIALIIILGYSLTKRFTYLCHLFLGLGLALAPIGSFIAVSGRFDLLPILFSISVLFWVSGFDIIYSLQDEEFDKSEKLYSIPVLMGKRKAMSIARALHIITFVTLLIAGLLYNFKLYYWIGFSLFSSLLVYQHTLIKPNDLSKVNIAFFTTNGIASIIFGIFVIIDIIRI
jgi:4-hydroxybenzoate polyprenyltransferase